MNKLNKWLLTGAITFAAVASAQTPQTTPPADEGQNQQQQSGQSPQDTQATSGTVNPRPSTSPTEGTAADTTPPGATPTPGQTQAPSDQSSASQGSNAKGTTTTLGDDSGESGPTRLAAAETMNGYNASQLIGASVRGTAGESVGTVQEIQIDRSGKVSQLMIVPSGSSSTTSQTSSIAWEDVQSVDSDGKITVDASRVRSASSSQ